MAEIIFDVVCQKCGDAVEAKWDDYLHKREVEPCSDCEESEYNKGYDKGNSDREEVSTVE